MPPPENPLTNYQLPITKIPPKIPLTNFATLSSPAPLPTGGGAVNSYTKAWAWQAGPASAAARPRTG